MFYKALGYAVWNLAMKYLRLRYGRFVKPGAVAATAVVVIAVWAATRGGDEE